MRRIIVTVSALVLALTACGPAPENETSEASTTEETVQDGSTTESGDQESTTEEWDGELLIANVREALTDGAFPDLADVAMTSPEPGLVVVMADDDTPYRGDAGAIVGETCETVPELEQVSVDNTSTGGQVIGPVDTPC